MKIENRHKKILEKFIDKKLHSVNIDNWNFVMRVVDKIESIIGHAITIDNEVSIGWWYSPKKTGTFQKGAGGGGGWTENRKPFDSIFGKYHEIDCYYLKGLEFKPKPNEVADSKIEAVVLACCRWIVWYNKNVKKKSCRKWHLQEQQTKIIKEKKIRLPNISKYKLIKNYDEFQNKCRFGGSELAKFIINTFRGNKHYFYNSKLRIKFYAGKG